MTAITSPNRTYNTAIFIPKILIKSTKDPRSTIGDEIKKENVTPRGSPAPVKPMKSGIEEQEQKGVTVPRSAASILADSPLTWESIFLVLSGGK